MELTTSDLPPVAAALPPKGPRWRLLRMTPFLVLLVVCACLIPIELVRILENPYVATSDFAIYQEAATRFAADPATLYTDVHTPGGLSGWFYPPPAVLLFLPFVQWQVDMAFFSFLGLVLAGAVLAVALWNKHAARHGPHLTALQIGGVVLVCLASGPTYHNFIFGQVNFFVLLLCIGYFMLLDQRRPLLAGVVLALGIWLKMYPALLLVVALRDRNAFKSALAAGAAVVALPLLLLPIIPAQVYATYFNHFLPDLSRYTVTHMMNQSFEGMTLRAMLPLKRAITWHAWPLSDGLKMINNLLLLASALVFIGIERAGLVRNKAVIHACLLALMPMFSPLGWGYTYALAMPAMIQCFIAVRQANPVIQMVAVGLIGAFLLPSTFRLELPIEIPKALLDLVYARYFLGTLAICALLLYMQNRHERAATGEGLARPLRPAGRVALGGALSTARPARG